MWDPIAEFRKTTLTNGLVIQSAHWPERPWQVFQFIVRTGANHDAAGREGEAHFLEHVVNNNALLVHEEFMRLVQSVGGSGSFGSTSFLVTRYGCFVPIHSAREIVGQFAHMLVNADIRHGVEKERKIILQEFDQRHPFKLVNEANMRMHAAVYGDTALGRMIGAIGTKESVAAISLENLRERYAAHYIPRNITIITAGGMSHDEVSNMIMSTGFREKKTGVRNSVCVSDKTEIVLEEPLRVELVCSQHPGSMPPDETPSYSTIARVPGSVNPYRLALFAEMLGKRLMAELRDNRRWTYNVGAFFTNFAGFCEFVVECDSFDIAGAPAIEPIVTECIASLATMEDGLAEAIKHQAAVHHMTDLSARTVCRRLADMIAIFGRPLESREIVRIIESTTMAHAADVVRLLEPRRRATLLTRP